MVRCPQCNDALNNEAVRSGNCGRCGAAIGDVDQRDLTVAERTAEASSDNGPGRTHRIDETPGRADRETRVADGSTSGPGGPTGQQGDTVELPESGPSGESERREAAVDRQGDTVRLPQQPEIAENEPAKPIGDRRGGTVRLPQVASSDDDGPAESVDKVRGDTDVTIDSAKLDDPQEKGSTLPPPAGAATADFGTSELSADSAERLTGEWGTSIANAHPGETIKGYSERFNPAKSTLVVHPRAVRNMNDTQQPIADYDLLGQLGEGGMGVVYSARQASIDRTVAIKMLKPSLAVDDSHRKKFLSEAVVTGELDHPNIVPIYDMGTDSGGALFYSMKQVQGKPWLKVIRDKSLQENLEILMKVADAIAFAHSRGVVHRDLKPENVMLGEFGEVLMLDWGMAMLTPDCEKSANVSQIAARGGTPGYMAPEMAAGPLERVGKHSDVYLLGAILYECMTGRMPHSGKTVWECLRAAEENRIEPTEHSGELDDIALKAMAARPEDRYESVPAFQQAIREYQSHSESIALSTRAASDLDKAKLTDDYDDYSKARHLFNEAYELWRENTRAKQGLSEALLAYAASAHAKCDFDLGLSLLDGDDSAHRDLKQQLTQAKRERDARQQRLKSAKRTMATLAALVFVVIVAGSVLVYREWRRAEDNFRIAQENAELAINNAEKEQKQRVIAEANRDEAKKQRAEAVQQKSRAEENAEIADQNAQRAAQNADDAAKARDKAEYEAYVALIGFAASKIDENAFDQAREALQRCNLGMRNWEWRRLRHLCQHGVSTFRVGQRLDCVAYDRDATRLATGSRDGVVRIWDKLRGKLLVERALGDFFVAAVAFSPTDDRLVAVGSNDPKGVLRIWNLETESERLFNATEEGVDDDSGPHTQPVVSLQFSRDGKRLLTGSFDNTAKIWDVETGLVTRTLRGHTWWVWSASFSPDETRVVTASEDATVRVWELKAGKGGLAERRNDAEPFRGHRGAVYAAAFSPDGEYVASGGYDSRVLIWKPAERIPFDFDKLLRDEHVARQQYVECVGHSSAVRRIQFSHDGARILSCSNDNSIRLWYGRDEDLGKVRVKRGDPMAVLRGHGSLVTSASFSPRDGDEIVSVSHDQSVRLWNVSDYAEQRVIPGVVLRGHNDAILAARFSSSGRQIVTASRDRTAKTWDPDTGQQLRSFREGHLYMASRGLLFPDGQQLLTAAIDGTARVWNVNTGTEQIVIRNTGFSAAIALSHDGRWILTGSRGDERNSRDTIEATSLSQTHATAGPPTQPQQPTAVLPEDPGTGSTNAARLLDARDGSEIKTFSDHDISVTAVAFSETSRFAFTGDADGRGNLWNVDTGRQMARLRGHTRRINSAVFVPGSLRLLTASDDHTVFQWDLSQLAQADATGGQLIELTPNESLVLRHPKEVTSLSLSADAARVLTGCADGAARLWTIPQAKLQWTWRTETGGNVNSVAISGGGSHALAVDSENNIVAMLAMQDGSEMPRPKGDSPHFLRLNREDALAWSATFSPDDSRIVTVGGDEARLWDRQGNEHMSFGPHRTVAFASFSPDEKLVVTASWDNSARIWQTDDGRALLRLGGAVAGEKGPHRDRVNSAVFSPDGQNVLTASQDGTIKLWDATNGRVLHTFVGHEDAVTFADYSPDGRRIVSSSRDTTARIWDVKSGQQLRELTGHRLAILQAVFSSDGQRVVTGGEDFTAKVWDAESGAPIASLHEHTDVVTSVAFSPNGDRLLTGCADHAVRVWDATKLAAGDELEELLTLKGHTQAVTSVSFSNDGNFVLSSSRDGTAVVWLAETESSDVAVTLAKDRDGDARGPSLR